MTSELLTSRELGPTQQKVLEYISISNEVTIKDLISIGIRYENAKKTLWKLYKKGILIKTGKGKYKIKIRVTYKRF